MCYVDSEGPTEKGICTIVVVHKQNGLSVKTSDTLMSNEVAIALATQMQCSRQ